MSKLIDRGTKVENLERGTYGYYPSDFYMFCWIGYQSTDPIMGGDHEFIPDHLIDEISTSLVGKRLDNKMFVIIGVNFDSNTCSQVALAIYRHDFRVGIIEITDMRKC